MVCVTVFDFGSFVICAYFFFCRKLEKQKEKKRKEEQKRKIASLSFNPEDEGEDEEDNEEEEQDCEYRFKNVKAQTKLGNKLLRISFSCTLYHLCHFSFDLCFVWLSKIIFRLM